MITVLLPISRTEYLRAVFNCLAELDKPKDTELIIITDGNRELEQAVNYKLESINFHRIQIISFGDTPAEDIDSRRYRISAIHNKAKHFVSEDCDYVMLVEDDTVYPSNTLDQFLKTFRMFADKQVGFVQGVELGRHDTPYIGAWTADSDITPTRIESVMPKDSQPHGWKFILAGGLYCCLVRADLYRQHTFEPYYKGKIKGLSCDFNFGIWMKQKGYNSMLFWNVQCDHIGERGSVNLGNTTPRQVIFEKTRDKWFGRTIA